jgi:hypothetical protein
VSSDDLRAFVASMDEAIGGIRCLGVWVICDTPDFNDFTKEIVQPGVSKRFPLGACGVRTDDNFWIETALPPHFAALSVQEIVAVLWPDIEDPTFNPDVRVKPLNAPDLAIAEGMTMENQHQKITGYRDLTQDEIDLMNEIKEAEASIAGLFRKVQAACIAQAEAGRVAGDAPRQTAIARSEFEAAFMRLARSVAQPASPWIG